MVQYKENITTRRENPTMSLLFSPYTIKEVTLSNRIVMSPMCMYSCVQEDGKVTDWHQVHYASRASGQVGLVILEASAVTPQGRISARDLGIWSNEHVAGLRKLTELIHAQGSKAAIQLAHAGRKSQVEGPIIAPSAIPFDENSRTPEAMTLEQITATVADFKAAAVRARDAGMDIIEIHAAHGYLINEFLSPLTNRRTDEYGGSPEARYKFLGSIIDAIRAVWNGPLLVRISSDDYHPEGYTVDDYVFHARQMKDQGVDLIDCSSGAVVPVPIQPFPGYQVRYSETLRRESGVPTGAVGLITEPQQAEAILQEGKADLIFLGRELLRDPYWPRRAARELGAALPAPKQYERGWM
jgi:NADPH2 dehydrogenase